MNDASKPSLSPVSQLLSWVGSPLNWSMANRVLLACGIVTPLAIWYLAALQYHMANPAITAYLNRDVLTLTIKLQTAVVTAWLALTITIIVLRKRMAESKFFVHALFAVYIYTVVYFAYLIGLLSSMFPAIGMMAAITFGMILLDKHIVVRWVALGYAVILGLILLEQRGVIPYAPLFNAAPFENGGMHSTWLLTVDSVVLSMLLVATVFFYLLINNWHERDLRLKKAMEQLARANEVITRYVPAQVAEGILAEKFNPALKYERRKVTVVFSDVKGFTEIADKLEPEEISRVLNEYLSEMAVIAERHGGTLDQFLGDGVLIYFGAPVSTNDKDHAIRAIRMSLEMQARVVQLSRKWQSEVLEHPFEIRIGINTGYASVGNFGSAGRMAYMAVGRPINLAARLQTNCMPGKILISHSTWLLVRDQFNCQDKGEIQVKGTHFPVRIYEVEAPVQATSPQALQD